MRKRIYTLLLLIITMTTTMSAYDFMVNYLCYNINNDGTSVTLTYRREPSSDYYYDNYSNLSGAIEIPGSVKYAGVTYTVTAIGNSAFHHFDEMTSVTIPNSVTSIGEGAFSGCSGLTSVTIPNPVTSIGESAFYGCSGLTSVTIPNSVTSIGWGAFYGCSGLTSVTIPNSVTSIGEYAFYGCSGLTSVTIPNSVTSIGERAFEGCSGLTSVTIGNSVTTIGWGAFASCSGLTSVTIPNSVTSIGGSAFWYCTGLTSVTIPNSVTSIGYSAFRGCSGLTSVTIPNSVTSIGEYAFYGCSGLTSVTIPDSVTEIPYRCFYNCSSLTSVTIPNSVTSIGSGAFYNCSGLTSVTWNAKNYSNFSSSSYTPFNGLTGITSFVFGNEVEHIPAYLCYGLTGLTSVTIPNSVTSIGDGAFTGCSGLTSVNITDLAAWCNIDFYSYGSNPLSYAHNLYLNGSKVTNLVIPSSVTTIKKYTFYKCSGLTSVTIPNSVTSIGESAFYGCSGLTSVTIPNSVTSIGESAFRACSGLCGELIIPDNVTTIADHAFNGCSKLASLIIGNSVSSIGFSTFRGCRNLTSINFGNSLKTIGDYAFYYCTGLKSLTIPSSVTSVGDKAFSGCSFETVNWDAVNCADANYGSYYDEYHNQQQHYPPFYECVIGSFNFGNTVTKIPAYICYDCDMTELNIPASVSSIGSSAFNGCTNLRSIYSKILAPENVSYGTSIFNGVNKNNCRLWVPNGTSSIYKQTEQWKDFSNIVETSSINGLLYGINENGISASVLRCYLSGNIFIPNSITIDANNYYVTTIGEDAFKGCSGLTSVTIPSSVTSIGGSAFSGCSGLTSVTWNAKNYSDFSSSSYTPFNGLTGITSFVFGNEVEHIPAYLCYELTGLTSVTIPNSVTSIGRNAFSGTSWYNNLSNGLVYAGMVAYKYKGTMPDGTSIVLIDGCKSVTDEAFYECSGLTSVTIPNSVTSIGSSSFNGCTNLRSIYSKILAPENVSYGTSIFNGVSINYCKLYVPVGTLDSYQFTAPWNDFLNIIEYDYGPEFIMGDANGDGTIDVADYVDVASYILEQDPQPFNFAAADLDEDNSIDVGDLVGVAYLALNYEGAPMLSAAVGAPDAASLAMNAVVNNTASGQYEVAINLSNNVTLSALQMDINLPQGMTLVDASLSDRANASHQVVFNQLANGDYRLLASSSACKSFAGNDGTVLTLTLSGSPSGNGRLSGIKLAAPSSTRYIIDDIELNFTPTGIDNVTTAARIYSDDSNIIIDSLIDGTAQIVLPNGMNKTVKVATGRNVFETPTKGLVIVKMGNIVEKLQF